MDETPDSDTADRPHWDDEYIEEIANRLVYNYDLEKDQSIEGVVYDLYGLMQIESKSHIFHPMLDYGNHFSYEHLLVRRRSSIRIQDIKSQIELGHQFGKDWIAPDEEHYSTDFSFISIVPTIPASVLDYVKDYKERKLIKLGYHGHYEINLIVVAPEEQSLVASRGSDVHRAFATWKDVENVVRKGLIGRIIDSLRV